MMPQTAITYRPEIDGLRALAVIPVILFHAGVTGLSGGFIGVDIFFVISGYLITGILLQELQQDRFSIMQFYERRARRILPALFFVILATLPFAYLWMLPVPLQSFGDSITATSLFGSNILFWQQSGYFDTSAELKPLLHTWSLAVEEQYYILFPPALWVIWKLGKTWLLKIAFVFGIILSFVFAEWAAQANPDFAFYMLPARAWELLIGATIATWIKTRQQQPTGWLAELGALLGLGLVIAGFVLITPATPWPGRWALLPVLGTGLLILCATPANLVGRLLALKPIVFIGLLSYSAYLWHQPLFAFARIRAFNHLPLEFMLGLALLAFGLAWFSWKYVEAPFRNKTTTSTKTIFTVAITGIIGLSALGLTLRLTDGVPSRIPDKVTQQQQIITALHTPRGSCKFTGGNSLTECKTLPDAPKRIAIWGDSHADALAGGFSDVAAQAGIGTEVFANPGCVPIGDVFAFGRPHCPTPTRKTLAYLTSAAAPDTILLVARWPGLFDTSRFDNGEGGIEPYEPYFYVAANAPAKPLSPAQITTYLGATINQLTKAGKKVIIVRDVPAIGWNVSTILLKSAMFSGGPPRPLSINAERFEAYRAAAGAVFAHLAATHNFTLIDSATALCHTTLPGRCMAEHDGIPLYRDDDHLNKAGATLIARHLLEQVKEQ